MCSWVTTTAALLAAEPPAPVAVRVYVVVEDGQTTVEPVAASAPIPWSIDTVVALRVVQASVEHPPAAIRPGVAVKAAMNGAVSGAT